MASSSSDSDDEDEFSRALLTAARRAGLSARFAATSAQEEAQKAAEAEAKRKLEELQQLKPSALRKRAIATGIEDERVEDAEDADGDAEENETHS